MFFRRFGWVFVLSRFPSWLGEKFDFSVQFFCHDSDGDRLTVFVFFQFMIHPYDGDSDYLIMVTGVRLMGMGVCLMGIGISLMVIGVSLMSIGVSLMVFGVGLMVIGVSLMSIGVVPLSFEKSVS